MPSHSFGIARRRAFSIVELLVVIAVLILLVGLVMSVTSRVHYQQKVATTRSIMNNIMLAIDTFQREAPLASIYNRKDQPTFGTLPPYQPSLPQGLNPPPSVRAISAPYILEDDPPGNDDFLADRLARDLGASSSQTAGYVSFVGSDGDAVDDNRALYMYLRVFSRASLASVPEQSIRPILGERVNPKGTGFGSGSQADQVDVLGFHDAWGVPLDYLIYVKYEWGVKRNSSGTEVAGFRVVDRRPVLRSYGIEREVFAAGRIDADKGVWTDELPKPWAAMMTGGNDPGNLNYGKLDSGLQTAANGWLRLVAKHDGTYNYRPD